MAVNAKTFMMNCAMNCYTLDERMLVSPSEIALIIKDLWCNKSAGLDGITVNI